LIDTFFLAEAGYEKELAFVKGKKITIENKVKKLPIKTTKRSEQDGNIHLLFSGTLAPTTGVFIAIDLATKLYALNAKIRLLIVGFSALPSANKQIRDQIRDKKFIELRGGDHPVPHPEILTAICAADFGVIAYPPNLSTVNTIPTKLFEYLGYRLPILLIRHQPWTERCKPYEAAVMFDPSDYKPAQLLNEMLCRTFYPVTPTDVLWESEEAKLLLAVAKIIK
jgi:hypothetical protein